MPTRTTGCETVSDATETRVSPRIGPIVLVALFVTALVTSQVTASKLLEYSVPLLGTLAMPGGTIAYAFTFFASDCMSELYGERFARRAVNVGFLMNFVLVGIVWVTIRWPAAQGSIDPALFETVLGFSVNIVLGSLSAYIVSQNFDVFAFHRIREFTDGRKLWARNVASTGASQLLDTVIFTAVAFALAPTLLGIGEALPLSVLVVLMVGQYVAKLAIAAFDTPLVYGVVSYLRSREGSAGETATSAD
ncbi:integral membrane-like protein [Halobacteriales archaeon QH_6_64_20]|nr:MAG: integral membrane-like protein [Halobacteriales archaeon QH_6_64_20]